MTIQEKTIYRCGHCRKLYLVKGACERHEQRCWRNPVNQYACFDCKFLVKDRERISSDMGFTTEVRRFHCSKLDKDMHTVIAVIRKLEVVGHTELMPLKCEHRKDDIDEWFEKNPGGRYEIEAGEE
jgi:hypothetical protein